MNRLDISSKYEYFVLRALHEPDAGPGRVGHAGLLRLMAFYGRVLLELEGALRAEGHEHEG